MVDNSIEILGQKFSYPLTWSGAVSVIAVCACIGFLGWTLDDKRISSYAKFVNGDTKEYYEKSSKTITQLIEENKNMKSTINNLVNEINLTKKEKKRLFEKLELDRFNSKNTITELIQLNEKLITKNKELTNSNTNVFLQDIKKASINYSVPFFHDAGEIEVKKENLKNIFGTTLLIANQSYTIKEDIKVKRSDGYTCPIEEYYFYIKKGTNVTYLHTIIEYNDRLLIYLTLADK